MSDPAPATTTPILPTDSAATRVEKAAGVVPSAAQLAWQRRELSGFIHFGPNTFTDREWGEGTEPATVFAPTDLDTRQWAAAFKDAGFKQAIMVAKHHDGFALFPSRYTDFSVASDTAWRDGQGDVVREFTDAMREHDLGVGFYLSPSDLHEAQAGGRYANGSTPRPVTIPTLTADDDRCEAVTSGALPSFEFVLDDYNAYYLNQLYELLTEYGPVDEVWLDGANPTNRVQEYDWGAWFTLIETLQPQAVVFNGQSVRWVGNESAVARETEWSVLPFKGDPATTRYNNELDVEWSDDLGSRERLTGDEATYLAWFPAECDAPLNEGWFWHADTPAKSLDQLKSMYLTSVGRNGLLLLSLAPDRRGRVPDADVARLREFGAWIRAAFGEDPLLGAVVTASSGQASAAHVADGDADTCWRPEADTGEVTVTPATAVTVSAVILQEAIAHGQRIEAFAVEALVDGAWRDIAAGTTVGYKRILPLDEPVVATALRVRITAARAVPALARVGISSFVG